MNGYPLHQIQPRTFTGRCKHGHDAPLTTTDGAFCICGGWAAWISSKAELQASFEFHVSYSEAQVKKAAAVHFSRDYERHTLRMRGPSEGRCEGCDWTTVGDKSTIEAAHWGHRMKVKETLNGS